MLDIAEIHKKIYQISTLIGDMESLQTIINHYSEDKPGPAYMSVRNAFLGEETEIQMDRKIAVEAFQKQYDIYESTLKKLISEIT